MITLTLCLTIEYYDKESGDDLTVFLWRDVEVEQLLPPGTDYMPPEGGDGFIVDRYRYHGRGHSWHCMLEPIRVDNLKTEIENLKKHGWEED